MRRKGLRVCSICGQALNRVDWLNHRTAHLSDEEKELLREQMREERNPRPLPSDEVVFRGFTRGSDG